MLTADNQTVPQQRVLVDRNSPQEMDASCKSVGSEDDSSSLMDIEQ